MSQEEYVKLTVWKIPDDKKKGDKSRKMRRDTEKSDLTEERIQNWNRKAQNWRE